MDAEGVEIIESGSSLAAQAGAEVDKQVATAKRYPRSVERFKKNVEAAVLSSQEVAEECFYHLERKDKDAPNGKKIIEGPSIRFAEVLQTYWGNLRIESGVSDIGDKYATTYGACWDLETNVAERFVLMKRITTKSGYRYSEDMAVTAANAARSIAKREAILKSIPKILWEPIWEKAREAAIGKSTDLPARRQKLAAYFQKIGVGLDRVLAKAGRASLDELSSEDIFSLKGMASAVKNGEALPEEMFPSPGAAEEKSAEESTQAQATKILDKMKNAADAEREAIQKAETTATSLQGDLAVVDGPASGASTLAGARRDLGAALPSKEEIQGETKEEQPPKAEKHEKKGKENPQPQAEELSPKQS